MDAKSIDAVVGYTKEFIDAVTPIAKHAYETGLVTLQIDAAQTLFISVLFVVIGIVSYFKIKKDIKEAIRKSKLPENQGSWWKEGYENHLPGAGALHFIWGFLAVIFSLISFSNFLNIWLWVKLSNPSIWLAHQAVEKLLK